MSRPATLITGGAGFIGANLADRLVRTGKPVIVFDNFSRPGVERNIEWLQRHHREGLRVHFGDTRDIEALRYVMQDADQVFHFAAQVAVTTSITDPQLDYEVNAGGTFNVLEAARSQTSPPSILYTSTNKVYGDLGDIALEEQFSRYTPLDARVRSLGVNEDRPLNFHTPYGCSKGAAEQYVLDYSRTFNVPAVVFRMSCIYGPHQFGTEDQGWVAHFVIQALEGRPVTLYGDGKQVRDILFVDDLLNACVLAQRNIKLIAGRSFNIGGGPNNTISLLELLDLIRKLDGRRTDVELEPWRKGDQRYYVSDTTSFQKAVQWRPTVTPEQGIARLYDWLAGNWQAAGVELAVSEGR